MVADYSKDHPNVKVEVTGGINDNKIVAAIRAGTAPDVVSSFNSYNVGVYCGSGGWIDLAPFMKKDGISTDQFPAISWTEFRWTGSVRVPMPVAKNRSR